MKNLIRLVIRVLIKQKKLFIFLLVSLSISMALIILTSGYLASEYSCDKFQKNYNRIYRIINSSHKNVAIESKFYSNLISDFPSIDKVCRYYKAKSMLSTDAKNINIDNLVIVDSTFFDIFDYQISGGYSKYLINAPDKIVISQSLAKKLFGNENPLGKAIQINKVVTAYVTGVFDNNNTKSHIKSDAIVSLYTKNLPRTGGTYWNNKGSWRIQNFSYYITVKENIDVSLLEHQISDQYVSPWIGNVNLTLQPLSDIYWNDEINDNTNHANIQLIFLLISITIVIALIASINYINLSLSNIKAESKIVSMFKILGALRKNMLKYYFLSGFLIYCLSFIIACILAVISLPLFNELLHAHIYLNILFSSKYFISFIGFIIILFVLMGLYPLLLFSGINPLNIFHGNIKGKIRLRSFSSILVILQFIVALVLITSVILIFKQVHFMKNKNPGFDTSYLINQKIHYSIIENNKLSVLDAYKNELLKISDISNLSVSDGVPFDIHLYNGTMENGYRVEYLVIDCDTGFTNILGLQLIEGRKFLPSDNRNCLITHKLAMDCGYDEPTKEKVNGRQVVGILQDINGESLHENMKGIMFRLSDNRPSNLTIKISSFNIPNTIEYIKKQWIHFFPEYPFEYNFYNDIITQKYESEQKLAKSISIIACLAIILCCLGLLGLVLNVVENKNKEIGIRKVNGAKIIEVLGLLNKDFVIWIIVAFIIAIPISWYFIIKWFENFACKTEISWWVFILSGFITLIITFLTVTWQSWQVARKNPVEALRYE